ncbi:MAG: hypothetical protein ACOYNC_17795 [Bacteroidales bacterium]
MKKSQNPIIVSLIFLSFMAFARIGHSQAPPPPPEEKGTNSNKAPGGGAPIDGGLTLSLAMVAAFGGWKWYKIRKRRLSNV